MSGTRPALLSSVLELVGTKGLSISDFRRFVWLSREFGFGPHDQTRALNFLLEEGILVLENGLITPGVIGPKKWLIDGLSEGDNEFHEFLAKFPKASRKFDVDQAVLSQIGLQGELFVLSQIRSQVDPDSLRRVIHVSEGDDTAGFDILAPSVRDPSVQVRLEVKTTFRPGQFARFFITRNEARVGAMSENWFLVFVRKSKSGLEISGHLTFSDIEHLLPSDNYSEIQWSQGMGNIDFRDLRRGLP